MGREVRRVPADWQHPKHENGEYKPLFDRSFDDSLNEWEEGKAAWDRGEYPKYADAECQKMPYEGWGGERPREEDYMPTWPENQCTHYMMYENTSEGTPISPAFETPEKLARWLADNNASAFAGQTASYEGWLHVAKGGYAPSCVAVSGGPLVNGVDAMARDSDAG